MEWLIGLAILYFMGSRSKGSPSVGSTGGLLGRPTGGKGTGGLAPKRPLPGSYGLVPVPVGDPPPGNCRAGWYDTTRFPSREAVKAAFAAMGYAVPGDRATMNALGPDGQIGGGDDQPSLVVGEFQAKYNSASLGGRIPPGSGGLKVDGFVGPCTLAAIQRIENTIGLGGFASS